MRHYRRAAINQYAFNHIHVQHTDIDTRKTEIIYKISNLLNEGQRTTQKCHYK